MINALCFLAGVFLIALLFLWLISMMKANPRRILTQCPICNEYRDDSGDSYMTKPEGFDDFIRTEFCDACQKEHDARMRGIFKNI